MNDFSTHDSMAEALLLKDKNVFGNYFTKDGCIANMDPDVTEKAKNIFKTMYPDDATFPSFDVFYEEWKKSRTHDASTDISETSPPSQICNRLTFDPSKREMVSVLGPRQKKNRSTEFDVYEFLSMRQGSGCPIRFQSDVDLEPDLEVLMEPQKNTVIDAGLRKIARAVTVLNSSCSYRLLDVHSERIVH